MVQKVLSGKGLKGEESLTLMVIKALGSSARGRVPLLPIETSRS
jgi:hypothetical protein